MAVVNRQLARRRLLEKSCISFLIWSSGQTKPSVSSNLHSSLNTKDLHDFIPQVIDHLHRDSAWYLTYLKERCTIYSTDPEEASVNNRSNVPPRILSWHPANAWHSKPAHWPALILAFFSFLGPVIPPGRAAPVLPISLEPSGWFDVHKSLPEPYRESAIDILQFMAGNDDVYFMIAGYGVDIGKIILRTDLRGRYQSHIVLAATSRVLKKGQKIQ